MKEEVRGIINRNPSKWGVELKKAMESVGEGRIWGDILEGRIENVERMIERTIQIKIDQELQLDWAKVDKSNYCKEYKHRKKAIGMEVYWEDKNIRAENKETWARLRCGNIGKSADKGFESTLCSLCAAAEESMVHMCMCGKARERIKRELVDAMDEWIGYDNEEQLALKIEASLNGKPVPTLCSYVREFGNIVIKERAKDPNM